jgi:F0F1-type ATP synthase delta subunit
LLISRDLITYDDFDFEEKINKFIEPYLDGKSFSSALSQVNNLLEYLVTKKEIGQLKEIQEKVFQIINQHERFKLW